MSGLDEGAKLLLVAEFWINARVILDGVIAPESSFAVYFTDWVDGHEPKGTCPEILYAVKVSLNGGEGAFRRVLANIHFIDDLIADPGW